MERIKDQVEFALFSRSPAADLFIKSEHYYPINNNLKIITLLTFSWLVVFGIVSFLNKKRSWEVKNLTVSFIHSVLAVIICSWALLNDSLQFFSDNTPHTSFALQLSFSYFLYDYIISTIGGVEDRAMCLHHFIALTALGYGLFIGRAGTELSESLLLLELSNPFLHLRGILVSIDELRFATFILLLEVSFVLLFFFARVIYGGYLLYRLTIFSSNVLVVLGVGMYLLSLFWFYVIMRKVYDKFLAPKENDAAKKAN